MKDLQDLNEVLKELIAISNKFQDIKNKKLEELSQIDLEISDIYHYIEIGGYNAVQASKVFKLLRQTLSKRRDIKDEFDLIQALSDSLSISTKKISSKSKSKSNDIKNKNTYICRTTILQDNLGVKEKELKFTKNKERNK